MTVSVEVMKHHHVVRDGSWWLCIFCRQSWPFPAPVPREAGPCKVRKWESPEARR